MIAEFLLVAAGIYLLCGFVFAIPFVLAGTGKIDPHATHGSWGFRVLIIPGTVLLWPLLLRRWLRGVHEPPAENNAHRRAALECGDLSPLSVPGRLVGQAEPRPAVRGTGDVPGHDTATSRLQKAETGLRTPHSPQS